MNHEQLAKAAANAAYARACTLIAGGADARMTARAMNNVAQAYEVGMSGAAILNTKVTQLNNQVVRRTNFDWGEAKNTLVNMQMTDAEKAVAVAQAQAFLAQVNASSKPKKKGKKKKAKAGTP